MPNKAPGKHYRNGISLVELIDRFPDEASARAWFESIRWAKGRTCPHCASTETKPVPNDNPMPYHCGTCRKYFSVKTGTVMQSSNLPLRKWVIGFYLMSTNLKGVSSMKLHRDLKVTQKTAWMMAQKIRQAWNLDQGCLTGLVEVDETYISGKEKNKHASQKPKLLRGTTGKQAVIGMRSREGKIKAKPISGRIGEPCGMRPHRAWQKAAPTFLAQGVVGKRLPYKEWWLIVANAKAKVIDLFAGAGGFSLGFQMAGAEVVGAVELDEWAGETIAHNHPKARIAIRDIETICDSEVKETFAELKANILIGGPPCQGFSVCRQGRGDPKDPRNSLFEEFLRFGRLLKPDLMVMENVPNLVKAKTRNGKPVIDIILHELEDIGYDPVWNVLHATDYGIPQIRKRLFIIASKTRLDSAFPEVTHIYNNTDDLFQHGLKQCPTLWDAISDLPVLSAGEGKEVMPYSGPPNNDYQAFLRTDSGLLHNHRAMRHSKRTVERFATMSWGDSISDVPHHLRPKRRNSDEIAETVYDQNNRRQYPHRPCHTIPASFYANFVHPFSDRNFTAREGARIQSFPDSYVFKGKPTVVSHKLLEREGRVKERHLCQYNQIGNAVPPLMAKSIAINLFQQVTLSE